YTTLGAAHGGDYAQAARYRVQVHYYLPDTKNPGTMISRICLKLAEADFTSPDITPAHSEHGQHYAIECEYCDGGLNYGACEP
ncbi:MAG: hypothetical protein UHI81_02165, partial [Olegusella sp.]|nr:hypothetical protein [Olegusella sp.]